MLTCTGKLWPDPVPCFNIGNTDCQEWFFYNPTTRKYHQCHGWSGYQYCIAGMDYECEPPDGTLLFEQSDDSDCKTFRVPFVVMCAVSAFLVFLLTVALVKIFK